MWPQFSFGIENLQLHATCGVFPPHHWCCSSMYNITSDIPSHLTSLIFNYTRNFSCVNHSDILVSAAVGAVAIIMLYIFSIIKRAVNSINVLVNSISATNFYLLPTFLTVYTSVSLLEICAIVKWTIMCWCCCFFGSYSSWRHIFWCMVSSCCHFPVILFSIKLFPIQYIIP